MDNKSVANVVNQFKMIFQEDPTFVVLSRGRMEIVGNHTDHQGGSVLVSAIDLKMYAAIKARNDSRVILHSGGYPKIEVDISDLNVNPQEFNRTSGLIRGVVAGMKKYHYQVGGFDITLSSQIAPGSGVSSSAAIEILLSKVIAILFNEDKISPQSLAIISQYAENVYFGKPSGLLDQMGIALGGINYIHFQNIDDLKITPIAYPFKDLKFMIINTGGSHTDLTIHYALVKEEMMQIATYFGQKRLIDVDEQTFFSKKEELIKAFGARAYKRGQHFFNECRRVELAKQCLLDHDEIGFLRLINESGRSSERLLENITYPDDQDKFLLHGLEYISMIIQDGAYRVHGGGFAGTLLAIVRDEHYRQFSEQVNHYFGKKNVFTVAIEPQSVQVKAIKSF